MQAGNQEFAEIRRMNDDESEQASQCQGSDQLKEATCKGRTSARRQEYKYTAGDIQEDLASAVPPHGDLKTTSIRLPRGV